MTEVNFTNEPGAFLLEPLPHGAVLPEPNQVSMRIMRETCNRWIEREMGESTESIINSLIQDTPEKRILLHEEGRTFSVHEGVRARVVVGYDHEKDKLMANGYYPPILHYPVRLAPSYASVHMVLRQWIEGPPSKLLAKELRSLPLFEDVIRRIRDGIVIGRQLDQGLIEEEPGLRECLQTYNDPLRVALMYDLPCTPGSLRFLTHEAMNRIGDCQSPDNVFPTYGVLVKTLCLSPEDLPHYLKKAWYHPEMPMHGSVIATIDSSYEWSEKSLPQVPQLIKTHRQWWNRIDYSHLLDVKSQSGRPKSDDPVMFAKTEAVLHGELTAQDFIEWFLNYVEQRDSKNLPMLGKDVIRQRARTWLYDHGYRKNRSTIL